jgi:hypothetical protein
VRSGRCVGSFTGTSGFGYLGSCAVGAERRRHNMNRATRHHARYDRRTRTRHDGLVGERTRRVSNEQRTVAEVRRSTSEDGRQRMAPRRSVDGRTYTLRELFRHAVYAIDYYQRETVARDRPWPPGKAHAARHGPDPHGIPSRRD